MSVCRQNLNLSLFSIIEVTFINFNCIAKLARFKFTALWPTLTSKGKKKLFQMQKKTFWWKPGKCIMEENRVNFDFMTFNTFEKMQPIWMISDKCGATGWRLQFTPEALTDATLTPSERTVTSGYVSVWEDRCLCFEVFTVWTKMWNSDLILNYCKVC